MFRCIRVLLAIYRTRHYGEYVQPSFSAIWIETHHQIHIHTPILQVGVHRGECHEIRLHADLWCFSMPPQIVLPHQKCLSCRTFSMIPILIHSLPCNLKFVPLLTQYYSCHGDQMKCLWRPEKMSMTARGNVNGGYRKCSYCSDEMSCVCVCFWSARRPKIFFRV